MPSLPKDRAAAEIARIRTHLRPLRKLYRHLNIFATRSGSVLIYFRHKGQNTLIPSHPITEPAQFHIDYCQARDGEAPARGETKQNPGNHAEGTWNAAIDLHVGSTDYTARAASTKRGYNAAITLLRKAWGPIAMAKAEPYHIEEMIDGLRAKGLSGNDVLTVIRKVSRIARKRGWLKIDLIGDDLHRERQKNPEGWRPYEPWEIEKWRQVYSIGSMARLAFELVYNHALARSDVVRVAPSHIGPDGALTIARQKTKEEQNSTISDPDLLACLALLPPPAASEPVDLQGRSTVPFLRNSKGAPFTADTFGRQWRKWADAAGLPSDFVIHGARKSFARDSDEMGVAETDAMRVMGQSDRSVFQHYAKRSRGKIGGARASQAVSAARRSQAG